MTREKLVSILESSPLLMIVADRILAALEEERKSLSHAVPVAELLAHFENIHTATKWAEMLNELEGLNDDSHPCCVQIKRWLNDILKKYAKYFNIIPIEELARKKGFGKCATYFWHLYGGKGLQIFLHKEGHHKDNKEDSFTGDDYYIAEAAARKYLQGLPDKKENV